MASVEEASAQVRRIAILVTSLDATAGRQLLLAMPGELAREVRRAMTRLTHVDPEEQRQILAEFRSQAIASPLSHTTSTSNSAATTAHHHSQSHSQPHTAGAQVDPVDTTTGASAAHGTSSDNQTHTHSSITSGANASQRPWQRLDVTTLTKLLRGERATVIAVVLSQLDPKQAAALLEQLPRAQHREIIGSLATLGQIDPDAMTAIDDYLASRIADYQHRDSAESETVGRLQQLLSAAPASLKADWQDIIRESDVQLAQRMGIDVKPVAASMARANVSAATNVQSQLSSQASSTNSEMMTSSTSAASSLVASQTSTNPSANSISNSRVNQHAVNSPTERAGQAAAVGKSNNRSNLAQLWANNVVTTADSQMPLSTKAVDEDEPRVLPFPSAAAQAGNSQSLATSASTPVVSAQQASADDRRKYPEVVLAGRETTNPSNASPSVRASSDTRVQGNPSALARFEHLLDLPAEMIGQTLAECDTEIVLLALAGASPAFMQRFISMLERQDARALKARIRQLGPIHLQDVDEAQRRVCEVAIRIVAAAEREQAAQATLAYARAA